MNFINIFNKNAVVLLLVFFSSHLTMQAQSSFTPIDKGSRVGFSIKNFGLKTNGTLSGVKGVIHFNPANLSVSDFAVSVDANTINTNNNSRDGHLKKAAYFDVANHPTLSFKSSKITESTVPGRFFVVGNLTIKGITKTVQFGFSATLQKEGGYLFEGSFKINRLDYAVGSSSISLQDNLTINLTILAKK
jgi:polyisoprenoid-binding protein YceI